MQSGFIRVFKNKNFLKIWGAQIFSQTANHLLNFLLVVKVYDITHSNLKVSIIILCFTAPSILFSIYAGVFADRFSQKRIMSTVNLLRALLTCGFILFDTNLIAIYIFVFLISSSMQFFLPAEAARIPAIVDKEDYLAANSLYIFTNYGAMIFGFSLVSFIQFVKWDYQFLIIALGFLTSSIALLFLPYDKPTIAKISKELLFTGVREYFLKGWSIIKSRSGVYLPIAYLVFVWVAFGIAYVMVPPLTSEILNIPTSDAGMIVILPAVLGTAVGALIVEKFGKKLGKKTLIAVGIFIVGITGMAISLIPEVKEAVRSGDPETFNFIRDLFKNGIIAVLLAAIGFGAMFIIAPAQTLLQENTEKEMMGTVFGFLNMLTNVLNVIPVLLVGYIADQLNIKIVLFSASAIVIIFGIANISYLYAKRKKLEHI